MPKLELTSQERSALRAAAHPLHPVVLIGDRGLSTSVLDEIDRSLKAHELIKVRVAGAERADREAMLQTICDSLSCAPVHHLGKTLIIYRPDVDAQREQALALNKTRAVRKPSEPYTPKKQAALGPKPKAKTRAVRQAEAAPKRAGRPGDTDDSSARPLAARAPRRPAAAVPGGIPRRSSGSGSALTLRPGARRGRTTRS